MDAGKRLGQLAAYEISFVEDHDLQKCIYQFISEENVSVSTAKGKKLRAAFEDGKLEVSQIKSILRGAAHPPQSNRGGVFLSHSLRPLHHTSRPRPPQSKLRKPYKKPWLCISKPWEMLHNPVKQIGLGTPIRPGVPGLSFYFLQEAVANVKESLSLCPRPI